jgi:hypothetical protein
MRLVPLWQPEMIRGVAFKTKNAIATVGNDDRRGWPTSIKLLAVAKVKLYPFILPEIELRAGG